MKKFIVAILAIFYLSGSTGATIHLHYCMGKLVEWGLWHKGGSKCNKCGMQKNHQSQNEGCCKDEHKLIKNVNDQKLTETVFNLVQVTSVALPTSLIELPAVPISSLTEDNPVSNAPPRSRAAIYIRNCVFRI